MLRASPAGVKRLAWTGEPLPRAGRPGHLLDRAGVAVARLRQVDVPATHAAEGELQASGVTGRHRAPVVPCRHRDRLLAHGAHSERCRHRSPSLPARGASRGSHSQVREADPAHLEAGAELPERRRLDLPNALLRDAKVAPDGCEGLPLAGPPQPEAPDDDRALGLRRCSY
jgi:hypothetical protein